MYCVVHHTIPVGSALNNTSQLCQDSSFALCSTLTAGDWSYMRCRRMFLAWLLIIFFDKISLCCREYLLHSWKRTCTLDHWALDTSSHLPCCSEDLSVQIGIGQRWTKHDSCCCMRWNIMMCKLACIVLTHLFLIKCRQSTARRFSDGPHWGGYVAI